MTAHRFLTQQMRVVRILWGALTFSCVLFGVVTAVVPSPVRHAPEASFLAIFAALAVAVAIASFVVPARMLAANLARVRVEKVEGEPTPNGPGPARFANPVQAARRAVGTANTSFILSMALSEVVAMLGLVLHMQGAPMTISTGFIAAGTLLSAVRFPSLPRIVGPFERSQGASFAASEGGSY